MAGALNGRELADLFRKVCVDGKGWFGCMELITVETNEETADVADISVGLEVTQHFLHGSRYKVMTQNLLGQTRQ